MPIVRFDDIGALGVIKDLPEHELPKTAWTDGQNVRFENGRVEKMSGESQIYNMSASTTEQIAINPWYLQQVNDGTNIYWIYAGKNKVYAAASNSNNNEITRWSTATASAIAYSATPSIRWNGGVLGGIPVLNNGVDAPQVWNPIGLTTHLIELDYDTSAGTKWSDVSLTAKVVRPYRNYLVALDVTKSSTRYPFMVKWSHPADPGSVPESWDETDATKDAGESDLAETPGYVIDGLQLRDTFFVYKQDSIYSMQYIGGSYIFRFSQLSSLAGIMSRDCVVSLGNANVVLTRDDLIMHGGAGDIQSVLSNRWQKTLFNDIEQDYYENCFLVHNRPKKEIWICYPESGASLTYFPTKALIWNYKDQTFTVRELSSVPYATMGVVDFGSPTRVWSDLGLWSALTWNWEDQAFGASRENMVLAKSDSATAASVPKILLADNTDQLDNVNMVAFAERQCLPIVGERVDLNSLKYIRDIRPKVEAVAGTELVFKIGTQNHLNDVISWTDPLTYTVGDSLKLNLRKTGRYISFRVESASNIAWALTSYELNVDRVGHY